jgi:2-aminoethylphosphonate-pyruvate transaminase
MKRMVLLNPGPVNVTDRVRDALLRGDLCHREKEFSDLLGDIRRKIPALLNLEKEYSSVLVSGSGTAALEMGVSSCLNEDRTMLIIQNGVYGERIGKIADAYKLKKHVLNYPWGTPPRLEDIEAALKENPDIEVVAMVHHETTTGLINFLEPVGELAHRFNKHFLVDGISSFAGDEIDFAKSHIDFFICTANKCIQGIPGVAFLLVRNREWKRIENISKRSLYLDLHSYYLSQEKGDTPFTPAIQAHYALNEALDELKEETIAGRIQRYGSTAKMLRQGFSKMGLEFLIPEQYHSNSLTAMKLPEGVTYEELHDHLKENGFVIYAGQGGLSKKIFRIANMGNIHEDEFKQLLVVIEQYLKSASTVQMK